MAARALMTKADVPEIFPGRTYPRWVNGAQMMAADQSFIDNIQTSTPSSCIDGNHRAAALMAAI
jgi:hypothetical protein